MDENASKNDALAVGQDWVQQSNPSWSSALHVVACNHTQRDKQYAELKAASQKRPVVMTTQQAAL